MLKGVLSTSADACSTVPPPVTTARMLVPRHRRPAIQARLRNVGTRGTGCLPWTCECREHSHGIKLVVHSMPMSC
jgi:hypothetical protein